MTLQPIDALRLDAAILFSDILTVPDAMGLGLSFAEGEGPRFAHPVRSAADVDAPGRARSGGELRYVTEAVRLIRRELARPRAADRLLGQPVDAGLPTWSRAAAASDFARIKAMALDDPPALHRLLALMRAP